MGASGIFPAMAELNKGSSKNTVVPSPSPAEIAPMLPWYQAQPTTLRV